MYLVDHRNTFFEFQNVFTGLIIRIYFVDDQNEIVHYKNIFCQLSERIWLITKIYFVDLSKCICFIQYDRIHNESQ